QRIQEFGPDGSFIRQWAVPDWAAHAYDEPYLSVDPRSGDVLATDPQQLRVLVYTGDGRLIGAFGTGKLDLPIGVAAGPEGRVAVTDATGNRLLQFSLAASKPAPQRTSGKTPLKP